MTLAQAYDLFVNYSLDKDHMDTYVEGLALTIEVALLGKLEKKCLQEQEYENNRAAIKCLTPYIKGIFKDRVQKTEECKPADFYKLANKVQEELKGALISGRLAMRPPQEIVSSAFGCA